MSTSQNTATSQQDASLEDTTQNKQNIAATNDIPPADLKLLEQLFNQNHFAAVEIRAKQLLSSYPSALFLYNILGLAQDRLGKYEEAITTYKTLLQQDSNNLDASRNLGLVYLRLERVEAAEICFHKALKIKPDDVSIYKNLAILYNNADRFDEALSVCRKALELQPSGQDTHNIMGSAYSNMKHYEEAVECFKRALDLTPQNLQLRYRLAVALSNLHRFEEALAHYQKILTVNPDHADSYSNSGLALTNLGKHEEALVCYQASSHLKPQSAEVHFFLGNAYVKLQKLEQATESFKKAISLDANFERAYLNLAFSYRDLGQVEHCCITLLQALDRNPSYEEALLFFAENLRVMNATSDAPGFRALVKRCLEESVIDSSAVSSVSLMLLRADLTDILKTENITSEDLGQLETKTSGLLTAHLKNGFFCDLEMEKFLCRIRKNLLNLYESEGISALSSPECMPLLEGLAFQGDLNEYLWPQDENEVNSISQLQDHILHEIKEGRIPAPALFLLLCAYEPLYKIEAVREWAIANFEHQEAFFKVFLKKTILERKEEHDLITCIDVLTPIEDNVSLAVQGQYEDNPYPRWESISHYKAHGLLSQICNEIKPNQTKLGEEPQNLQILIAGCGTGKQPLVSALQYKNSQLLAVDLSKASLAYAQRKANELNIQNITFGQADILKLSELQRTFDMIECCGVLHHMAKPEAGLQSLLTCLKPNGYLKLALYSEIARKDIVDIRQKMQGDTVIDFSTENLRKLREDLYETHPEILKKLQQLRDFFSTSELRDMLLHVQEHRYTLSQLKIMLENHKLEFLGFVFHDQKIKKNYLQHFPSDLSATNLENWHNFEQQNPQTFLSMYQFWCRKS